MFALTSFVQASRDFMESGLMAPGVKYGCDWMRHEDWFEGNAVARGKYRLN
jgi:hypothetical protein